MDIGQDVLIGCLDCGYVTSESGLINGKCPQCGSELITDEN